VDAASGNITTRIELCPTAPGSASDPRNKRGPRGLALKPGAALYVLNRIANTISVIELVNNIVAREIPIGSFDPTPPVVRNGRGFLYDAKLSGNGTVSCSSCHIDAEMDLIAWDLGDPRGTMGTNFTIVTPVFPVGTNQPVHPMKGPMTTQTLRGLKGLAPLHWRGDRTNFQHFNGAFDSLLGGTPLATADMQAYADFVDTIVFQPNPNQNLNRTYPTNFAGGNAEAGRNTFFNELYQPFPLQLACTTCHTGPPGPGSDKLIFARQALQESQDFKVPHLRNVYQKLNFNNAVGAASIGGFGIIHDGMDPSLFVFLSRPVFGTFASDTTRKNNLSAFVQCFDSGMAPAVGYARTLVAANVNTTSISNDWSLLEAQATVLTNINLVVKGTIDGIRHGLLYQPGANNYKPDTTNATPFTRSQITAKILAGDTLTFTGVPPGAGQRMGIDRDGNGVLDADEPPPSLQIAHAGGNSVIKWPLGAAGFNLETATSLPSDAWSNVNDPVEIIGALNFVTNAPGVGARFFRLRLP
jgi:hypothetical protein